jgi:hypothetical protein
VIRFVIVAVTIVAVVAIGITIWVQIQPVNAPAPAGALDAPRQYDTMGGQEIRPRWDGGGQVNDAPAN